MPVAALRPDLLYVVLFGPGYGESIAVRVPPNDWLVVDSLTVHGERRRSNPALELVRREGGELRGLVLTHPHHDHADGFDLLVDAPVTGFLGCVIGYVTGWREWISKQDAEEQLRHAAVESALNAIADRWERMPHLRWELDAGTSRPLGNATVHALHPDRGEASKFGWPPHRDPNRIATPLLIEWEGVRILLGSDLLRPGWTRILERIAPRRLNEHHLLKVPHHGSSGAQHRDVLAPCGRSRAWLLTPWTTGGRRLPRFDDGEGISRLLETEREVHLTTVVGRGGATGHIRVDRETAHAGTFGPAPRARLLGRSIVARPRSLQAAAGEAFIVAGFAEDGSLPHLQFGDAALTIFESSRQRRQKRSARGRHAGARPRGG